jgi:hypothetical protein
LRAASTGGGWVEDGEDMMKGWKRPKRQEIGEINRPGKTRPRQFIRSVRRKGPKVASILWTNGPATGPAVGGHSK